MAQPASPEETLSPPDTPNFEVRYRLALGGAFVAAAVVAIIRLGVNAMMDGPSGDSESSPHRAAMAPVWGTLGLLIGLVAGAALSMRPQSVLSWLGSAATSGVLSVGVFGDWDSIQLLFRVGASVCAIAGVTLLLPLRLRLAFYGGCILLHYLGILSAVTSPSPQPWISQQGWTRVFRPYLHFTYMNNAYQFYSPDPGPARQIWFCVEYDPKDREKHKVPPENKFEDKGYFRWLKIPLRPEDYTDPLGQAYFRRLSVAEYTAQFPQGNSRSQIESKVIETRRNSREDIRRIPEFGVPEYQPPTVLVQKAYLPSYVQHIAQIAAHPDFNIRTIKFYRVTHRIIQASELVGINGRPPTNPEDPTTYQIYFQGEFDAQGKLLKPFDPMLFWHLPIRLNPDYGFDPERLRFLKETNPERWAREYEAFVTAERDLEYNRTHNFEKWLAEYEKRYLDYVTIHAGYSHLRGGNLP